jgi:twitching motility protein PilI
MARKIGLREFHQQVLKRLENLAASGTTGASRLAVEIAGENWLVDLSSISEVIPLPAYVPVPLTHSWFLGMANVRGNLYGITDFAAFLGRGHTPAAVESRVLLLHPRFEVNAGLLVRRVYGLRGAEQFEQAEALAEPGPFVRGQWRGPDGGIWRELDLETLVRNADFLNVGLYRRVDVVASAAPAPSGPMAP